MKTQQVLILQHSNGSPPGSTIQWLKQKSLPYHIHHYGEASFQPNLEKYHSLVICGGGMNVDEEHLHPWLHSEKKLIETAMKKNMPTIGLCLGAQLIAEVLGAKVHRHSVIEAGWHDIHIDPTVHHKINFSKKILRAFQWHSYAFETPLSAIRFAHNEITPNQGFLYQDHVVATQFHPETTIDWTEACLLDPDYPQGTFCQNPEQVRAKNKTQPELQSWYFQLLEQYLQQK